MFCDIVGSTDLSDRLDPEDLRDIIRAYQEASVGVCERFDGGGPDPAHLYLGRS